MTDSQPGWRLIDPQPFPAAASLAVALAGNRRRRRPMPLGRSYLAHRGWRTPAGPVPGIAYQDMPPPAPGSDGVLVAIEGPRFTVLATADGLHVRRMAPDPSPSDLTAACDAIRRICDPATLARYGEVEVKGSPSARCIACGRPLVDAVSRDRGFGPECWGNLVDALKGAHVAALLEQSSIAEVA